MNNKLEALLKPWEQEDWKETQKILDNPGGRVFLFAEMSPSYLQYLNGYLQCHQPHRPCGQCSDCQMALERAHTHHRLHQVRLGQGHIGIDEIRETESFLHGYPREGYFKTWLIHDAATLRHASVNACLKMLEELPPYAVVLMATRSISLLPKTLLSRALLHRVRPPSLQQQFDWLSKQCPAHAVLEILTALITLPGDMDRAMQRLHEESEVLQTLASVLMGPNRSNSVKDADRLPKGHAVELIRGMMYLCKVFMTTQESPEYIELYQALLSVHRDLLQGAALRERSLYAYVLQKWYAHTTPTDFNAIDKRILC